jgi:hypothetical protein
MTPAFARPTLLRIPCSLTLWLSLATLLNLLSVPPGPLLAQDAKPTERVYKHPQADVEKALEDLQAYETARLPVLAGFVSAKANTLKDYGNPHYQFQIDLVSQGYGHTLVQVKALITAWYVGAAATHSQYAQIPSNGRLEEELLDRLSVYLEKGNKGNNEPSSAPAPAPTSPEVTASSNSRPPINPASYVQPRPASPPADPPADAVAPSAAAPGPASSDPARLASQIASLHSELQAVEQKERQSQAQIADLENVVRSRQRITDFAIAKKAQTPVFAEPSVLSKVLFRADPEDEFEVVEARNGWIRVRLEDTEQAWLPISEVEQPGDSSVSDDLGVKNFSAVNEVIQPFTGQWPVLNGKSALFVLAQPRGAIAGDTLGKSQLEFASHTFLEGYRAAIHSQQNLAGVVVVFAGDKPGVAAATLTEIRQWQEGRVSDKVFFSHCSFDPPESFRDGPTR